MTTGYWRLNSTEMGNSDVDVIVTVASLNQRIRQDLSDIHNGTQRRERMGKDKAVKSLEFTFISRSSNGDDTAMFNELDRVMGILEDDDVWTLEAPDGFDQFFVYRNAPRAAFSTRSIEDVDTAAGAMVKLQVEAIVEGVWIADGGTYCEPLTGGFQAVVPGGASFEDATSGNRDFIGLGTIPPRTGYFPKYGNGFTTGPSGSIRNPATGTQIQTVGDWSMFLAFEVDELPASGTTAGLVDCSTDGTGSDVSYQLNLLPTGGINFHRGSESITDGLAPTITVGAHTIWAKYAASTKTITIYLDGAFAFTYDFSSANPAANASRLLTLGGYTTPGSPAVQVNLIGGILEYRFWDSLIADDILQALAAPTQTTYKQVLVGTEYLATFLEDRTTTYIRLNDGVNTGSTPLLRLPPQTAGRPLAVRRSDYARAVPPYTLVYDGGTFYEDYDMSDFIIPDPLDDGDVGLYEICSSPSSTFLVGGSDEAVAGGGVAYREVAYREVGA